MLLDVKARPSQRRVPMRLRLLGFSRDGRIALLEQREGEEVEGGLWMLRVIDLATDRALVEREFDTEVNADEAFCRAHGDVLRRTLSANQVESSPLPRLSGSWVTHHGARFSPELRRRSKGEDGTTPYEVWLRSKERVEYLGRIEQLPVESGQNPVSAPSLLGVLKSPWEPRVAVLLRQDLTGIEAAIMPLVRVVGGRLWR